MERSSEIALTDDIVVVRDIIREQGRTVTNLWRNVDHAFVLSAQRIANSASEGRITTVTGMGKSGLVGRYLSSCLNAIGVPSAFLSPSEAVHGDIGILEATGVLVVFSVSGKTKENLAVAQRAQELAIPVCLISGFMGGDFFPEFFDFGIDISHPSEIDPSGMLPLQSSLLQMAVSNALVVAVAERIGFSRERLAELHPGGAIGEALKESAG